jgi:hypothetical protein
MYDMFTQDRANPNFLTDLIKTMEKEKVGLICRSHHKILHDKTYRLFKYLINLKDLFSFSPVSIYIMIKTAIDSCRITKDLPRERKKNVQSSIVKRLKKRYIMHRFSKEKCLGCKEFNIFDHLTVFSFHHKSKELKKHMASRLYSLTCSEILKILNDESGGYLCSNCHMVLHNFNVNIMEEILENNKILENFKKDISRVRENFQKIEINELNIHDPLNKEIYVSKKMSNYLLAIYRINKNEQIATNKTISNILGLNSGSVHSYLNITHKEDFFREYININQAKRGGLHKPSTYLLTEKGIKLVKQLINIRRFYESL